MQNRGGLSTGAQCYGPVVEPLEPEQTAETAATLKVLADPARLRLLALIAARAAGDAVCVCELAGSFELSQPTISHHLKVLRTTGLIDCERRGTWVYYWPLPGALEPVRAVLDELTVAAAGKSTGTDASVANSW